MGGEIVGRAGFHVVHTKSASERGAILHEAMRELDQESIDYWAKRNANIVVADEHLNEAMVNDGQGDFTKCTDRQQVIDYGEERMKPERLSRQASEDAPITKGPDIGKMGGGTLTTSLFVCHLPKSMCVEVPDYYPRYHRDGKPMIDPATGEQMMRSRWVAKDRDQARQYFEDVRKYLEQNVIPGGQKAILGYDIQHSESTPHIQIIADTLADDPKKEGKLRWDASRAYFTHRDVTAPVLDKHGQPVVRTDKQGQPVPLLDDKGDPVLDANGEPVPQYKRRLVQGKEKMSGYHEGLKQHLIERDYDISPDFDEVRHLVGQGKAEYEQSQDNLAEALAVRETTQQERQQVVQVVENAKAEADAERARLDAAKAALAAERVALDAEKAELPELRRQAREEGEREAAKVLQQAQAERLQVAAERQQVETDRQAARRAQEAAQTEREEARLAKEQAQTVMDEARTTKAEADSDKAQAAKVLADAEQAERTREAQRVTERAAAQKAQQALDAEVARVKKIADDQEKDHAGIKSGWEAWKMGVDAYDRAIDVQMNPADRKRIKDKAMQERNAPHVKNTLMPATMRSQRLRAIVERGQPQKEGQERDDRSL